MIHDSSMPVLPEHESVSHDGNGIGLQSPIVACAADDRYAMPLAVTMLTAARRLESANSMTLFVMDGGISEKNKERLEASWDAERIDVRWLQPDRGLVDDLVTSHHISPVAYFRILLPQLLPESIDKVLYLDSDLLVMGNIAELYTQPMQSIACKAIPDIACPYVDARRGIGERKQALPYLASLNPIRNYREFGIDPTARYFNSGVLLINLPFWRQRKFSAKMLECLRTNRQHVWCWDQYALNAMLANHWEALPLKWNLGTHAFEFPTSSHSPVDREEFESATHDPSVVHFTTEFKPWDYGIEHPYRDHFFEILDQTAWKGWRPQKPPFSVKRWWDRKAVAVQKRVVISYRKLSTWRA